MGVDIAIWFVTPNSLSLLTTNFFFRKSDRFQDDQSCKSLQASGGHHRVRMSAARLQGNNEDKANILKLLQSTLISSKGGVPLDKINRKNFELKFKLVTAVS